MCKKRAVAYCRVSTDHEDQLNSLAVQEEYFRTHMEEFGYELVQIYADEGITGTKKRSRKAFLKMLEDARAKRFDVLFVKDISRFARNTLDSLESVRLLKGLNIEIVFVNNQGILEAGSELMFTIMSAMAQEESVNMSKRVKFGKRQNALKGRVPNLVYGYDKVPGEFYHLHINEEEAAVVRRIFERYVYEGDGALAIAKDLNNEGHRTKRGCLWSQNAVTRIVKNRIYIGQVINGKEATKEIYSNQRIKKDSETWIVNENEELRIIPDNLFEQAQKVLEDRQEAFHMDGKRQSNRYAFSTLIKCKHCGRSFRRVERRYAQSVYVRWVCSSRNGDGTIACENATRIQEDELLDSIRDYLWSWKRDKETIIKAAKKEYNRLSFQGTNGKKSLNELRRQEQSLQNKLSKLKEMYMNDIISMDELKRKTRELQERLRLLADKLQGEELEGAANDRIEKTLEDLFCNMDEILSAKIITNEMLKQVIDKIEVDHGGNVDVILKPIDKIRPGCRMPQNHYIPSHLQ